MCGQGLSGHPVKLLVHRNSAGDSSSGKSEQSHQEASAVSDSSLDGQHTSTQSGIQISGMTSFAKKALN
jgi:hypothetical protein